MNLKPRRTILKRMLLVVTFLLLPKQIRAADTSLLSIITLVQHDLFPNREGVPTLEQIDARGYLIRVLKQSRVTQENKAFIHNGAKWLNEEALLRYKLSYIDLTALQRQKVLQNISKERWGENWIDAILGYIYEAMLSDPVYGGNKNGVGWKWLNHSSGQPRPQKVQV